MINNKRYSVKTSPEKFPLEYGVTVASTSKDTLPYLYRKEFGEKYFTFHQGKFFVLEWNKIQETKNVSLSDRKIVNMICI